MLCISRLLPGLLLALMGGASQASTGASEIRLPVIEIIATTPVHGGGLQQDQYPGNVQTVSAEDLDRLQAPSLSELLERRLGSVHINEVQNNPFQPDVSYRGLTASPLLGLPQGLAVYQSGVRLNESFGDTVNWDMLPPNAIADINLIPGSNPVFGMNALGGALSIETKTGFSHPGTRVEASNGSWDRRTFAFETGEQNDNLAFFLAGQWLDEDGWRAFSPTELRQLFGSVGWRGDASRLDLDLTLVDNLLTGNGLLPESTFRRNPDHVYTFPDETRNELLGLTLRGERWLSDQVRVGGNLFYRAIDRSTFNGDAELEPQFEAGSGALVGWDVEGENRRSESDIRTRGGTAELSWFGDLLGRGNQMTFGAAYERSGTDFRIEEQAAGLEDTGTGIGTVPAGPFDPDVDLSSTLEHGAFYFTNTFDLSQALSLMLSGRYNRTRVRLEDTSGENPALNGTHRFSRFSPAAGLNLTLSRRLSAYISYSEGFRAPTPVELTCADENDPCPLPNAFVADPPLDPVIGRTWETGARGRIGDWASWTAAVFRTDLSDDILFVQTSAGSPAGYFRNIGKTRRQGIELGLSGTYSRLAWFLHYTYLDATYRTHAALFNPVADPDAPAPTRVRPGDSIPGIPDHIAKIGLDYAVTADWEIGSSLRYTGSQYLRGDEANQSRKLGGYTLVDLRSRYRLTPRLELLARVDNLFDREYASLGAIHRNAFSDPAGRVERFVAPGAPRAGWIGVRAAF